MAGEADLLASLGVSAQRLDYQAVVDKPRFCLATLEVARHLLGALLCRRFDDGRVIYAPIVEVEAYTQDDPACHAYRGVTPRTQVLFEEQGKGLCVFNLWYVLLFKCGHRGCWNSRGRFNSCCRLPGCQWPGQAVSRMGY